MLPYQCAKVALPLSGAFSDSFKHCGGQINRIPVSLFVGSPSAGNVLGSAGRKSEKKTLHELITVRLGSVLLYYYYYYFSQSSPILARLIPLLLFVPFDDDFHTQS